MSESSTCHKKQRVRTGTSVHRDQEVLNLKPVVVDSKRGLLFTGQSKGRKDCVVPISQKNIGTLRANYKAYKPERWLFEGQEYESRCRESRMQKVLKQDLRRVDIKKSVTLHRHMQKKTTDIWTMTSNDRHIITQPAFHSGLLRHDQQCNMTGTKTTGMQEKKEIPRFTFWNISASAEQTQKHYI